MSYLTSGHIKRLKKKGQKFFLKIFPKFLKIFFQKLSYGCQVKIYDLWKNFFLKKNYVISLIFFSYVYCVHFSGMTPIKTTWYQMSISEEYENTIFIAEKSL